MGHTNDRHGNCKAVINPDFGKHVGSHLIIEQVNAADRLNGGKTTATARLRFLNKTHYINPLLLLLLLSMEIRISLCWCYSLQYMHRASLYKAMHMQLITH